MMQLYMLTTQMDGAKRAAMWLAVGFGAAAGRVDAAASKMPVHAFFQLSSIVSGRFSPTSFKNAFLTAVL